MGGEISPTGNGLCIVINCDYIPGHNWMSFASWYSINTNLPDAEVLVAYKRAMPLWDLFHWTGKFKVQLIAYTEEPDWNYLKKNLLVKKIPPYVMAVRTYNSENFGPTDVKNEDYSTFVSYINGCGGFNASRWIDNVKAPFALSKRFRTIECSANEIKVLYLWAKMSRLFSLV